MRWMLTLLLAVPALPVRAEFSAEAEAASSRLLITFKPGTTPAEKAAALAFLGAKAGESVDELDLLAAELPSGFAAQAAEAKALAIPSISAVENDFYWPNWLVGEQTSFQAAPLPDWSAVKSLLNANQLGAGSADAAELPWGIRRVGAPAAWSKTMGQGVRVAVVDTGIDSSHPDLRGQVAGGYSALGAGYMDDNGHGTHVSGTIAGALDGKGVAGVAPKARLYAVKVLDKKGGGSLFAIIKGIVWCAQNRIQVANMSLGSPRGTLFMRMAVNYAVSQGVTIVAAAGNSGKSVGYPGGYPSVIAVAASDSSDHIADFSSRGPEVDFIAPGVAVKSSLPGGGYAEYSGTSMATPHMAGLAALAVSRGAGGPDAVRAALKRAARSIGLKPQEQGAGLVDAALLVRQRKHLGP